MSRILVVDRERLVRELVSEVLTEHGYETVSVEDESSALELLESGGVDMVLLDLPESGEEGERVLRRFREEECLWRVPLVVLGECREKAMSGSGEWSGGVRVVSRRDFALGSLLEEVQRCFAARRVEVEERRRSFRVRTCGHELEVLLNGASGGRVVDLSAEGIGVFSSVQLAVGDEVEVVVREGGRSYEGSMEVRSRTPLRDGRHRYGLKLCGGGGDLGRGLAALCAEIQREQLRIRAVRR